MNSVFDYFLKKEVPNLMLCTPNKVPVASLGLGFNIKNVLKFNAMSELELDFPMSIDNGDTVLQTYSLIKNKMLVYVENVGYYIINECPEDSTGMVPIKHLKCLSLESEFLNRRMTKYSGTFNFYNSINPNGTLLNNVIDIFNGWSVGYVDPLLENVYRSFDSNNDTMYKFLISDVETAYSCVFTFDSFSKTISAYSIESLNDVTDVYLSFNNINKSVSLKEFSDEMVTALYCYGKDTLDINSVNPLGGNVIYNFDYYKTPYWMSQDLIDALTAWEDNVDSKQSSYQSNLTTLMTYNSQVNTLDGELVDLKSELASLKNIYDVKFAGGLSTDTVEIQIDNQYSRINAKMKEIADVYILMDALESDLRKVTNSLEFTTKGCLENFLSDVNLISAGVTDISSSWRKTYPSNSDNPIFSPEQLTASSAEIIDNLSLLKTELDYLFVNLSSYIYNYPISDDDIEDLKYHMNDIIVYMNTLYTLFSGLIPNTNITISLLSYISKITSYYDILDYTSNFTQTQYEKLQSFIYENTYTNENIIITDIMTASETQAQAKMLYDQGKNVLARSSVPRFEFEGDFVNFLSLPEYKDFIEQIDLGKFVTIEIDDNNIVQAALLEIDFTYDDPTSFKMTFGNRVRLNNSGFIFADMFSDSAEGGSGAAGLSGTATTPSSGSVIIINTGNETYLRLDAENSPVTGALDIFPSESSHTAFRVSNSDAPVFNVDTINNQVRIQAKHEQLNSNPLFYYLDSNGNKILSLHSNNPSNIFLGVDAGLSTSANSFVEEVYSFDTTLEGWVFTPDVLYRNYQWEPGTGQEIINSRCEIYDNIGGWYIGGAIYKEFEDYYAIAGATITLDIGFYAKSDTYPINHNVCVVTLEYGDGTYSSFKKAQSDCTGTGAFPRWEYLYGWVIDIPVAKAGLQITRVIVEYELFDFVGGTGCSRGMIDNVILSDYGGYYENSENIFIGKSSGSANIVGTHNTVIGIESMGSNEGDGNIFVGYNAGRQQLTASNLLLIDNQLRSGSVTELTNAIIHGTMASLPANQTLALNAIVSISDGLIVNEGGLSTCDVRIESDNYDALFIDASNDSIAVMNNASGKLGFYATAPIVRTTGWTVTNKTSDKVIDCNVTTIDEIADVLGTIIDTLKSHGLLGG